MLHTRKTFSLVSVINKGLQSNQFLLSAFSLTLFSLKIFISFCSSALTTRGYNYINAYSLFYAYTMLITYATYFNLYYAIVNILDLSLTFFAFFNDINLSFYQKHIWKILYID